MNFSLSKAQRIKVSDSKSVFKVVNKILSDTKIEYPSRRQCLVASLNAIGEIINVEMIAYGNQKLLLMDSKEVFGQSVAKRAESVILILNRVREDLYPIESEMEFIKRVYNCGVILGIELSDCLVINGDNYESLEDLTLMIDVRKSEEFYPAHDLRRRALEEGRRMESISVARRMLAMGMEAEAIINSTRLDYGFIKVLQNTE